MKSSAAFVFLAPAALVLAALPAFHANFEDIASHAGLTAKNVFGGQDRKDYILETTGNGVAIFDFDGDGRNDVFIANGTRLQTASTGTRILPQLYHNLGNGRFEEIGKQAGFTKTGWAQGVCVGDYDNDGLPDLLVTYYGHNVLYRNLGHGKFADATAQAKLPVTGLRYGSGCSFVDYDRDGYLDLFVANYVDLDLDKTPRPGHGDYCTWKGIPVMCGPRGLPKAHNVLYHNNRDGTFTDVSQQAGILQPGGRYGLGVVAADFDNDGWPDILTCNGHVYPEVNETANESGYRERKVLYRNDGKGKFIDVSMDAGPGILETVPARGCAIGDFNNDGNLDVVVNCVNDVPQLLRCDSTLKNNWLKVKTVGVKSNRSGIGARVFCTPEGGHRQMDEVRSGGSYISQSDLRIHFGLAKAAKADIEVHWPSGQTDKRVSVPANRVITVVEGHP